MAGWRPRTTEPSAPPSVDYELLDPAEQEAFRTLAVFVGGFDGDAASALGPALSLEVLARLVNKSLVTVMQSPRGRTRYRLLETVREFAHGLLADAGDLDAARERHFRHFASLADLAREEWRATGKQWFVNQLDDDYENVRAALEWSLDADPCAGTRVMGATRDLFVRFGQADGARLAPLLLERCDDEDRYRVETQIAASQFAGVLGEFAEADRILAQARELSTRLDDPVLEAWTRFFQGLWATLSGAVDAGREHLTASRDLHHELGIRIGEGRALSVLGMSYDGRRGQPRQGADRVGARAVLRRGGPMGPGRLSHVARHDRRVVRADRPSPPTTTARPSNSCGHRGTHRCCPSP